MDSDDDLDLGICACVGVVGRMCRGGWAYVYGILQVEFVEKAQVEICLK